MPTYEYECQECGFRFDQFQSMTAEPLTECSECKGAVKRLISLGGGVLFKGKGFYQTDYRTSDYQKKAKEDQGLKSKKVEPSASACGTSSKKQES